MARNADIRGAFDLCAFFASWAYLLSLVLK